MKIKFIFLGKKPTDSYHQLMQLYLKRLNNYIKSDVVFVSESNKSKLEKKILHLISSNSCLIALDESGLLYSTLQYKVFLQQKMINFSSLTFIVGDAYGIPKYIMKKSHFVMSLSKMTLPHALARVVLLEQTYRLFTIVHNHPYHHE